MLISTSLEITKLSGYRVASLRLHFPTFDQTTKQLISLKFD